MKLTHDAQGNIILTLDVTALRAILVRHDVLDAATLSARLDLDQRVALVDLEIERQVCLAYLRRGRNHIVGSNDQPAKTGERLAELEEAQREIIIQAGNS